MNTTKGSLSGLRVLDLSRILAGPYCTMLLGDLGADVIKVESRSGDDTRYWGPPFHGNESAYYLGINRNKRSMVIDFSVAQGREVAAELMKKCDVLVENFRFGTLERWGFDQDWFDEHAPALVRCSITGYGPSGPRRDSPGYDFILQAESGLMSICGEPDGEPTKYGVAVVDLATGMFACIGILAALDARKRTGRGQKVDVSLFESALALLANVASNSLISDADAQRYGNGHPNIVPYRSFPVKDGYLALAVGNDQQFRRFSMLVGREDWITDSRFCTNQARVENRELVDREVGAALSDATLDEWLERLRSIGVPCGKVNSVVTALADPQAAAREMVRTIEHPLGAFRALGIPLKFSDTPGAIRHPPPLLGEHTETLLRELLDMPPEKIERLRDAGGIA